MFMETLPYPVDLPYRGTGASELVKAQLWWRGPEFLILSEDKWSFASVNELNAQASTETVKASLLHFTPYY